MNRHPKPSRLLWSSGLVALVFTGAVAAAGPPPSKSASVPYTPSKVPGVMVRSIPSASRGGGQGAIVLLPGGRISDIKAPLSGSGQAAPANFALSGGGVGMVMPAQARPYAMITLSQNGNPALKCKAGPMCAEKPSAKRKAPAGKKAVRNSARRAG